jgi:uncharacterized protein GlcG (DUF336 family)
MARKPRLAVEALESRDPGASAALTGTVLAVTGTAANDHIQIVREAGRLVVRDQTGTLGAFDFDDVATITVAVGGGNDLVKIASNVTQPATIDGGAGKNTLKAGGGPTTITNAGNNSKLIGGNGANTLTGGAANEQFIGGAGPNTVTTGGGANTVARVRLGDVVVAGPQDVVKRNNPRPQPAAMPPDATLTAAEVRTLLRRAAAASASTDAIIAITDRNGRILGVRTEGGVASEITGNVNNLVFAIDGAVSLARTGAFFGNAQAPLTSRTIRNLSQSTITEREVKSNPNIPDVGSGFRGPGFVAPVGVGGHFPPNVPNTPEVDLFGIEHTNRDGITHPGADGVRGTGDDIALAERFNIDPAFVPAGQNLFAPDSYGAVTGLLPDAQNRGVATLPGGIPIFKGGTVAGGIGVFFPGKTGYATESNSSLGTTYDPSKPDRSVEAEYIAFAALGGAGAIKYASLRGVGLPSGIALPSGRIDLVGVQLEVFGPGGFDRGPKFLRDVGFRVGLGNPDSGVDRQVTVVATETAIDGLRVPTGWLVTPHSGVGISGSQVRRIIEQGIAQAEKTRAAIRLPNFTANKDTLVIDPLKVSVPTRMVFAVCDRDGNIVGLYRMPDATVFSIDVAVAKARNVNYYADAAKLQAIDRVPGVPAGTAFTNRTFRYLALPRFPSAVDGTPPAPFSILNDGGTNVLTGRFQGSRLPADAFDSVYGHDAFFVGTNFHDPTNIANQNGIIFFPGSAPLYNRGLIGGFGVSGDGVDQDDVVTAAGATDFKVAGALRADQTFFKGVRLPYQKFNRNPEGF